MDVWPRARSSARTRYYSIDAISALNVPGDLACPLDF